MHIDEGSREEHKQRSDKEADVKSGDNLQGSSQEGIFATFALKSATRQAELTPWRTEPEIGPERQEQLTLCLAKAPEITRGIYPFKGMKLSRADVEWLLAAHENGRGPRARSDEQQQNRQGLDLRGADLRYVDLHALPLARLRGSLTREEWDEATEEQRAAAAVLLTGADLSEAHLEGTELIGAHLEKVSLHEAHLEKADLSEASLERAFLARARLKEADLSEAHLEKADLSEVQLQGATLRWTHLEQAYLSGAHLEKADLSGAHLDKVYLSDAHLEEATLSEAHLEEGYLGGAYLQEADLSGHTWRGRTSTRPAWTYLFSLLLDLLAGYGYLPGRSLMAYLVVIFGFMGLYLLNAHGAAAHLSWDEALVLSVSSFHGRGFFLQNMTLGDAFVRLAAVEAVLGLPIEVSFIATFTQRFFGK